MKGPSLGLLGVGRWGRHILRDLVALGADVHVADPAPSHREAALKAGAASACSHHSELPGVDGYVVATPTTTHAEVVRALVEIERPIYCEKPLTHEVETARELVEIAGDRLFVMHKWRHHPGVLELAAQARAGALGDLLAVRTFRLGHEHPHRDVDPVWILMPHDLSIALEIVGDLPPVADVYGAVPGRPGCDLTAVLQSPHGGVRVTAEISSQHASVHRSVVVVGSEASVQLESADAGEVVLVRGDAARAEVEVERIGVSNERPLLRELKAWVGYLRGGPPPASSAAEGLLVVERIAQMRERAGLAERD